MKKKLALLLSWMLLITAVFSNGMITEASGTPGMNARGGVEDEEGEIIDGEVVSATVRAGFHKEGYYPATLQYAINKFQIGFEFEGGTNIYLGLYGGWHEETTEENGKEVGTGAYVERSDWANVFYMKFYNDNGEQVPITNSSVPVGEYTVKISRFVDGVEKIVWTSSDKLIVKDPADRVSANDGNTANFKAYDSRYEESWYPVESTMALETEYIYSASEFDSQYWFASIWNYKDGVATRINEGIRGDQYGATSFSQVYSEVNNTYLVIGDTSSYVSMNAGSVSWNAKKEIASISLSPESSYKMWTRDYLKIPVTVTYTDGTKETYADWSEYGAYMEYIGEDGGIWGGGNGLEITTSNNDVICLAMKNADGQWVKSYEYDYWKPGSTTWTAYVEKDSESYINPEICTNVTWNIENPTIQKLDYNSEIATNFSVTADAEAYYSYEVETADKQIEIANYSAENSMVFNLFKRTLGTDGPWKKVSSSYLGESEVRKANNLESGYEYLFILETSKANTGTIGIYVANAQTKSAEIGVSEVDLADGWKSIPVTVSFVGTDGETIIGTQKIQSWSVTGTPAALRAQTKYKEYIYCALYQGDTQVSVASSTGGPTFEELLEEFGVIASELSEEQLEEWKMVLKERGYEWSEGTSSDSQLAEGKYTLKVFKDSISDANLIGSKSITVVNSSAAPEEPSCDHKWNAGTVTKEPTCSENGEKTVTCTKCGATDKVSVPADATKHVWDEGYIPEGKESTCSTMGVRVHTCGNCGTTKEESAPLNPEKHTWEEEYVVDKDPTCTEEGSKSIHCEECNVSDPARTESIDKVPHERSLLHSIVSLPTCEHGAKLMILCKNCDGEVFEDTIIETWPLPHTYKDKVTKATTKANGKIEAECSECGYIDEEQTEVIAKPSKMTLSTTVYTYSGSTKKPTVKITDANGKTISSSNYSVSYPSSKNVGKYAVKVTFKGKYSGTMSASFVINPKKTSMSSASAASKAFTAKWKKQSTQVTGYQIQYSTSKKFSSAKTVTVSSYKTTSKKVTKLKAKTTYYVRVRTYKTVSGKKYYSDWSSYKSVKTK